MLRTLTLVQERTGLGAVWTRRKNGCRTVGTFSSFWLFCLWLNWGYRIEVRSHAVGCSRLSSCLEHPQPTSGHWFKSGYFQFGSSFQLICLGGKADDALYWAAGSWYWPGMSVHVAGFWRVCSWMKDFCLFSSPSLCATLHFKLTNKHHQQSLWS